MMEFQLTKRIMKESKTKNRTKEYYLKRDADIKSKRKAGVTREALAKEYDLTTKHIDIVLRKRPKKAKEKIPADIAMADMQKGNLKLMPWHNTKNTRDRDESKLRTVVLDAKTTILLYPDDARYAIPTDQLKLDWAKKKERDLDFKPKSDG